MKRILPKKRGRKPSVQLVHQPTFPAPLLSEWHDNEESKIPETFNTLTDEIALPVNPNIPDEPYSDEFGRGRPRLPEVESKTEKRVGKVRLNGARHVAVAGAIVNGTPKSIIAAMLKMSVESLEKEFEYELVNGKTLLNAQVASQLVKGALRGEFRFVKMYLETQAGYQSADKKPDDNAKDGLTPVERRQLAANLLHKHPEIAEILKQQAKKMKKEKLPQLNQLN